MSNVVSLPRMVKAKFVYFFKTGQFYLSADGFMRHDWVTLSNAPGPRRTQIIQDNKVMPGMPGRASELFICITTHTEKQRTLVLPEA
jgi:hypothetical protein